MAGWQCKPQRGDGNFTGEEGEEVGLPLCNTAVLKLYCLIRCCKRFYRVPLFLYFCCFNYFVSIQIDNKGEKCKLKCPKVHEINSELYCNCTFCFYSFLRYKHLYPQPHKNAFVATENP